MINRVISDRIDEVIDLFEQDWSADSRGQISSLLCRFGLNNDDDAVTELIRVDIDLRYQNGLPLCLNDYFDQFSDLLSNPTNVAQIAFEDYRARSSCGHDLSVSRWSNLPGVADAIWYQRLVIAASLSKAHARIAELEAKQDDQSALKAALESAGFRIIQEIGNGAFSRVYLAMQQELAGRFVVLKVVSQTLAEPQHMALLQHTNIVPIYSFHRIDSHSVICMPYAGSVTLQDFAHSSTDLASRTGQSLIDTVQAKIQDTRVMIDESQAVILGASGEALSGAGTDAASTNRTPAMNPLEKLGALGCTELASSLFQRLAGALAHSHSRGVLHGDLKPANVLIRNDGEPALLDFNLSTSLKERQAKHAGGTLPYMAPENYQALMGKNVTPHPSADIYSMGVMLFEFLTGRLPYSSPASIAPVDLQPAIDLRKSKVSWSADDHSVTPGLKAIINRCVEFAPQERYASADELQADLEAERTHRSLIHASEPRATRARKWLRRHPSMTSAASVAILLLTVSLPLIYAAFSWRARSVHLAKTQAADAFVRESTSALSMLTIDPERRSEKNIVRGMKALSEHGLLETDGYQQLISPRMNGSEVIGLRNTILRHAGQIGFLEVDRLRPLFRSGNLQKSDLNRLDQLIACVEQVTQKKNPRALLFLRASRAKYAGDPAEESLLDLAMQSKALNDTDDYLEAMRLLSLHQFRNANELLVALADRNTVPSALRWTALGRSQYGQQLFEDAKLSFTQSIERSPNSSHLHVLRGLCYMSMKQGDRAIDDFTQAIKLDPTGTRAWSHRGLIRLGRKQYDDAISDYTEVLKLSPGDGHALLLRSRAYRGRGMTSLAERDFADAMSTRNMNASSYIARSYARDDDDPEAALEDLKRANELEPDNPVVLSAMASLYGNKLNMPEQAIQLYRQINERTPSRERAMANRAVLLSRNGEFDEAKKDIDGALEGANQKRTYYQACCVYALMPDRKDHIRALGFLARAIRAGYEADRLESDPDLVAIREMDGFRAIARAYKLSKLVRDPT